MERNGKANQSIVYIRGSWVILEAERSLVYRICNTFSYTHLSYDYASGKHFTDRVGCYKIVEDEQSASTKLVLRRGFLKRLLDSLNNMGIRYELMPEPCRAAFTDLDLEYLNFLKLRPEQIDCLEKILLADGGVVEAPPGFGKSFLFPVLCRIYSNAKIDIVTHRRDVALQIYDYLNGHDVFPGIVTAGRKKHGRVTVYTVGSLGHSSFNADLVLADECHELVTPSSLKFLLQYDNARMFGFTATAKTRYDNAWFRLEELFGPVVYKLGYTELVRTGSVVPIVAKWVPVLTGPKLSKFDNLYLIRKIGIWNNIDRNKIIAQEAKLYHEAGNQVLIITKTLEHALQLSKLLPDFALCCSGISKQRAAQLSKRGLDVSKALEASKQRELLTLQFRNKQITAAIATEVWTTGVSFDDLEVLIRADADVSRTAAVQVPGRVCRLGKSIKKDFGLVVNFADCFSDRLYARSKSLFAFYKQLGWIQCDQDMNPVTKFPYTLTKIS